jgi:hypothetical protein
MHGPARGQTSPSSALHWLFSLAACAPLKFDAATAGEKRRSCSWSTLYTACIAAHFEEGAAKGTHQWSEGS